MPESVATSTEHNASSTAYVNKTRSKESICLPSPASKQRVNKTQLPETPHMPSDRRTIQTSGKTKKSSNLADVTHIVKRPVSSMFLQAATLGNTDSRVPPVLPDPPPTPLVHQDTDDEEFVIDESLFVPNLLVSIPRFGKTNKQLASESEIKRHEKVTDTNQARPIGSDIISNDGYNDKEHVFTEGQMVNSVEENYTALSEQEMLSSHERPPVEPIECVKSRPSKGGHRNKKTPLKPVDQSCEKANESSSSEGEHAMQKKTSAKQKKQKNKKKRNVESVKSRPSKGGPKNKKTLLEPIVQPDENTNDGGSSEGENAMQKKTLTEQRKEKKRKLHEPLKKGGQKKGSSALAPVTALPNENCNEQNDAINVSSKEMHTTELCSTSKKKVLPLSVNNQRLPSANENTLSSQEDEGFKKSKRRKRSSDDEPIPSTSDVRYSGRSQRTHKPPGNWWAVTSPEFDKTLSLRKQSSPKKTQKTSPKKKDKSKRVSVSKQRKKNDKKEAILSELPDSQPIDDATAKDASPNENNAVDNSGAKKNQKSQNPHKIVSGDENNIETPHSVVAASQGLPSSKSLGKRKVAEENDNQDEELPLPQKVIKSILKTDTQNSNRPALSKEPILDSMEESEDIISIGKVSSVQHSKTSHVAELRKSIMPGHTQENATNFRSSLASFGDAYIKSPHVQNISGEDCTELQTEEALLTGSAKKSQKKPGSSQTLKHTPRTRIESAVLGDEMHEVLNFEDHPLLQLHNKGTPRTEPDKVVIGSGPSLKRSVEFIKRDGIPATSELSDSSEFDDDHRKYNVRQRLVLPSNTPNVRRSRRTKVKPLQYWRGERVNYLSRPSGLVVDGIIPPSEKARGGKSTAKRKHIRKGQAGGDVYEGKVPSEGKRHGTKAVTKTVSEVVEEAEIHVADNTDFQLTDHTTVLDHAKGTEIQVECVRFAEHCVSSTQRDFISVTKALRNSTFSVGKLKLGPLQQKGYQFVCLDTIVFYIIHGLVEVTIHVTNYHLKAGDYFFVPPGNMYNIRNLKSEEAVLIFTQIKGSQMFVEESE
ncbi:centromere protein C isoform X2 [Spea bombifrons]|uniref:centromere protein C isoform X2 n=1 Tax=Spea bombifrons TaxID=233779 RepID=UPI00234BA59D|nr:centromere protein C isoform X2 [Spea bombifrons]